MNSTFKKVALASALLASTAMVTPAFAGDLLSTGTKVAAPWNVESTGKLLVSPGQKVRLGFQTTAAAEAGSTLYLHAVYLNAATGASNVIVGQMAASDATADSVADFNPTIQNVTNATHVVFFMAASNGANVAGGANALNAGANVMGLKPTDHNAITTTNVSTVLTGKDITTALATADYQTIVTAMLAVDANYAIPLTSTYKGPAIASIGKTVASGVMSDAKIQFNTGVAKSIAVGTLAPTNLGATDSLGADIRFQLGSATTGSNVENPVVSATTTSTGAVGTRNVVTVRKTGPADFSANYDNADRVANLGAAALVDLAGNVMPDFTDTAITAFAAPALASTGTAKVVLKTAGDVTKLYDNTATGGVRSGDGNNVFTIRLAESVTNLNVAEDVKLPTGLTFGSVTNDSASPELTVTVAANYALRIANTGELYLQGDGTGVVATAFDPANPTGTKVELGIAKKAATPQASVVKTSLGDQEVGTSADLTGVAYVGVAATPTVSTSDADASGTLDGVKVTFGAPVNTTLPSTTGAILFKRLGSPSTAADVVATAATILANSSNKVVQVKANSGDTAITGLVTPTSEAAARTNTGSTSTAGASQVPFDFALTDSQIAYTNVYAASGDRAGSLAQVRDIHANTTTSTITDGASPVVKTAVYSETEGSTPVSGKLVITASEALTAGTLKTSDFIFGGSSLQLLNLNDNVTATVAGAVSTATGGVTNATLTLTNVTSSVANKVLTLGAAPGYTDGATPANVLATDGSKTVTTGTKSFSGPKIAQAIATRSTNAVDGNIDQVLVKFDKAVTLASSGGTTGATVDGMFKVKATITGAGAIEVAIPKANIDLSSAATGYVTLNIPTPGIVGSTKLTALTVEYDTNGTNEDGSTHTSVNRLVSTDATPAEINETAAFGTGDDGASVTYAKNSTKLYTMEVTGSLTTDGSAAAAKGTIVRADLVDMATAPTVKSGSLTVPCSCAAGSTTLAADPANFTAINTELENAAKLGKTSINAYVKVLVQAATGSAVNAELNVGTVPAGDATNKVYPVTINVATGAVTGTAGATGSLVIEKSPALKVLDTVYQVTNTGAFRFAVGSDTAPANAFVLVSSKQPADKFFTGLTSAVPSFANYLPFASNVVASGVIGGNLGTVNLAKIASSSVSETTGWQLVGFQGAIARNSNAVLKATPVDATRLLVSIRPTTGQPVTAWGFDAGAAGAADDEAFLLQNNVTASALQIGSASIDGLKNVDGGLALALKNPSGSFVRDDTAGVYSITSTDTDTTISATEPFSVFYPISGDSTAFNAGAGKWSLLTVEQAVASASLSTWADTNKVAAIIVVGSGNAQKSWFKGSTTNTLTALAKGDRAFVYFSAANTAFKFGR
ncbi:beta strand repeat-containing protein [Novispirillum itersonii]|uniref:Uncharacterized protein n=1 Tax=Novispirillum itersonii TaxID=189 RepID=A0A7X0DMR9_NOVIT|nr:hypothetical protein [Novispirillum itersonii]MBB6211260.1 hypothetical protein [Novispirillum itersonii]